MTRIQFALHLPGQATCLLEDPRPPHELIKLINTGQLVISHESVPQGPNAVHAIFTDHAPALTLVLGRPPVYLTARHYEVLHALSAGERAARTARRLGISRRTVYQYISDLKERFGLEGHGRDELLTKAAHLGLVQLRQAPVKRVSRVRRANRTSAQ